MDENLKQLFKDYIECFHSIRTLQRHDVLDEESTSSLMVTLLADIIATFEKEVEDSEENKNIQR